MKLSSAPRPCIASVLAQHTEELAFTWQRRQRAWSAPMQRFKRWGTDEEAFAATAVVGLCASDAVDEATRAELDSLLIADARSVRGAAAALFWIGDARALPLLQRWWTSDQPVLWRAAFPACLPSPQVRRPHLIDDALQRSDVSLQARALRAIGEWRITERAERLPAFANCVCSATASACRTVPRRRCWIDRAADAGSAPSRSPHPLTACMPLSTYSAPTTASAKPCGSRSIAAMPGL